MPPSRASACHTLGKPIYHLLRIGQERKHHRRRGNNSHFAPYFAAMVRSKTNVHVRVSPDAIDSLAKSISIHREPGVVGSSHVQSTVAHGNSTGKTSRGFVVQLAICACDLDG